MENIIDIYDENGIKYTVEILDTFTVAGYEDKTYVVYTRNIEIDKDNVEVYVSILVKDGDNYRLETISDEEEWKAVSKAMEEEGFGDGE